MTRKIQLVDPVIRLKITGRCNRSCYFCHQEGDMKGIDSIIANREFFDCIENLSNALGISRIILTGGEPMLHPQLSGIISGIKADEISLTTNGIRLYNTDQWHDFKERGLTKVTISIHDVSLDKFLQLETKKRNRNWAEKSLNNQLQNIVNVSAAGISTRVNTVVYNDYASVLQTINALRFLKRICNFEIRLLNNLTQLTISQKILLRIYETLKVEEVRVSQRFGSSNVTTYYRAKDGFEFSTKVSFPYFFGLVCGGCLIRKSCFEGFYGVRVEARKGEYFVRLCLYKQSSDVLMSWKYFIDSGLAEKIRRASSQK